MDRIRPQAKQADDTTVGRNADRGSFSRCMFVTRVLQKETGTSAVNRMYNEDPIANRQEQMEQIKGIDYEI